MLKTVFLTCSLLSLASHCVAQLASVSEHGFYIPQNLTEANEQLDKVLTPKAQTKFKNLKESDLQYVYFNIPLINEWDDSRFTQYLNNHVQLDRKQWGYMDWQARQHLVLLSYLRHLNKQPFNVTAESHHFYAQADSVMREEERVRQLHLVADSIDGVYIPRNLPESFTQLDQLLPDTVKQRLRHPDPQYGLAEFHMGLGMWMRNNWQLWGGSRLQQYLEGLGIRHPDNMSGAILMAYSDYLNGKSFDEKRFIALNTADEPTPSPATDTASIEPSKATKQVVITVPEKTKWKDYPKEYRHFLRRRKIDDFHSLPPEAYAEY